MTLYAMPFFASHFMPLHTSALLLLPRVVQTSCFSSRFNYLTLLFFSQPDFLPIIVTLSDLLRIAMLWFFFAYQCCEPGSPTFFSRWEPSLLHKAYCPLGSPGTWLKGDILKDPVVNEFAEKLNKTPAQVALRWGIQSGHSVLPKSVNESRIKENFNVFDWSIPPEHFCKFSTIQQVVSDQQMVKQLQEEVARLEAELKSPEPSSSKALKALLIEKNVRIQKVVGQVYRAAMCIGDDGMMLLGNPPNRILKVNVDAAIFAEGGTGMAALVRDHEGIVIRAACMQTKQIYCDCNWIFNMRARGLILEGDSLQAISKVTNS